MRGLVIRVARGTIALARIAVALTKAAVRHRALQAATECTGCVSGAIANARRRAGSAILAFGRATSEGASRAVISFLALASVCAIAFIRTVLIAGLGALLATAVWARKAVQAGTGSIARALTTVQAGRLAVRALAIDTVRVGLASAGSIEAIGKAC